MPTFYLFSVDLSVRQCPRQAVPLGPHSPQGYVYCLFIYRKFASSSAGVIKVFLALPHLSHWEERQGRDTSCFLWSPAARYWTGPGRVFMEGLRADGKGATCRSLQFSLAGRCGRELPVTLTTRLLCLSWVLSGAAENTGRGRWEARAAR